MALHDVPRKTGADVKKRALPSLMPCNTGTKTRELST